MPLFQWTESISVSVKELDKQHQKLFDMINSLYEAMKTGKGRDVLGGIFESLLDYTSVHFKNEEVLFDQYNYPDKANHKAAHKAFIEKVTGLYSKFKGGDTLVSVDVLNLLKDWLVEHIMKIDKNYSNFFNEKGLN